MSYSEKLKDPRWQRKRLEIFQRDDFTCLACGDKTQTLHVHHLKYFSQPWQCPSQLLETLCETCHERRENFDSYWGEKISVPTHSILLLSRLIYVHPKSLDSLFSPMMQLIFKEILSQCRKQKDSELRKEFTKLSQSILFPKHPARSAGELVHA